MKYISTSRFKTGLSAVVLLFAALKSWSQAEFKNWNSAQANLSFTKKLDLRFSHLRAFDITRGYKSDFNQSSVQLSYDFTKKASIAVGYTVNGAGSLTDGGNRVSARVGYKVNLVNVLGWSNSIQGEMHSKGETRYHYRFIWSTRISPKKRFDFLNLSPSITYSLFYNIGGNAIQYYDKTGGRAVRQTADGFHRGRLMFNLNSKLTKSFSVSAYYMMQKEFNLFTNEYHRINITKPTTGRVVRAFDNFNVIGLTLLYDINLYSKKE